VVHHRRRTPAIESLLEEENVLAGNMPQCKREMLVNLFTSILIRRSESTTKPAARIFSQ
jgi:hypothetical protein